MRKVVRTAVATLTVLTVSGLVASAAGARSVGGIVHLAATPGNGTLAQSKESCFSQLPEDSLAAPTSAVWRDAPTQNSRAVDDFDLTSPCTITEVDVLGGYYGSRGPAHGFNVTLYAAGDAQPGPRLAKGHTEGDAYTVENVQGDTQEFEITLNHPITLSAGTYWVAVQARMKMQPGGYWYWLGAYRQAGDAALWKNPRNGSGAGCETWCTVGDISAHEANDLEFALVTS